MMMANSRRKMWLADVEIGDCFRAGYAGRPLRHPPGYASRIATAPWLMIAAGTNMLSTPRWLRR